MAFCSRNDSKIRACLNSYRVEIGSKCVNCQWLGRLGFYFMLLFIYAHFYFSYYCLLNNIYAWLLQKNTLKNNYWICEWMCQNKWDCSVRGRGGGLGRSQEKNPSQSGPSREEGSSEQRPVWWLTKESALGSLQRSGGPRGWSPWVIGHCGVSRDRGRSYWVHQLIQTNWKPSGGSAEPAGLRWVARVGCRVCLLCSSLYRVSTVTAPSRCSVNACGVNWCLENARLSKTLACGKSPVGGTVDTAYHKPPGDWLSSKSQERWNSRVLLIRPGQGVGVGGPGL